MYDNKIISAEALSASFESRLEPLRRMIATVTLRTEATDDNAAAQDRPAPDLDAFAGRYHRAGSLARRRIDALVHEAGIESMAGGGLIARRGDCSAPGSAAAVRFIRGRLEDAFRQIDRMLPLAA